MADLAASADAARAPRPAGALRAAIVRRPEWVLLPLLIAAALLLWDLAVVATGVNPMLMPRPWAAFAALWSGLAGGDFAYHLTVTASEALAGFAIAAVVGTAFGAATALSPAVAAVVYPYLVSIQTVPKIALAPLFVVWFGYAEASKIAVATILAFFPVMANVVAGLRDCDEGRLDVLRALRASRWQMLWLVRLPNALPYVFNGLGIAMVFALTGAIVGEFVNAQAGLGYLMVQANAQMDVPKGFAVMLVLAALGVTLFGAVRLVRRRLIYWAAAEDPHAV